MAKISLENTLNSDKARAQTLCRNGKHHYCSIMHSSKGD